MNQFKCTSSTVQEEEYITIYLHQAFSNLEIQRSKTGLKGILMHYEYVPLLFCRENASSFKESRGSSY